MRAVVHQRDLFVTEPLGQQNFLSLIFQRINLSIGVIHIY